MHEWLFIGTIVIVGVIALRLVLGIIGRLLIVGLLALVVVFLFAGGVDGITARADCVQRYPQIGSAFFHELADGCQAQPASSPAKLAATLQSRGIPARAVEGAALRHTWLRGYGRLPADVTAAVIPAGKQRFVVLYTQSHRQAFQLKRLIARHLHRAGLHVTLDASHLGVDRNVVYLDATSATQTPVTDTVIGL